MVAYGRTRVPGVVDPLVASVVPSTATHWWLADDLAAVGDGNAVTSWSDRISGVAVANTSTARPLYRATGLGSQPSVEFDGSNDSLIYSAADSLGLDQVGAVIAVVTFGSATIGTVWSSGDDAVSTRYLTGILASSKLRMQAAQTAAGAEYVSFSQSTGTAIVEWQSNGVWELRKNNAVQSVTVDSNENTGRWFGGVSGRDRFAMGALVSNAAQSNYLTGHIASLMKVNAPLTDPQRSALYGWLAGKYGISI